MKKILLLSIFIFSFSLSKAQWVTIPDANFVSWLNSWGYSGCMNGNLLDTTCTAVVNVTSINCSNQNISDLTGIQYFNSLTDLNCGNNLLTNLPTLPDSLVSLYCNNNLLTSLPDLPNSLIYLYCNSNQLTNLPPLPSSLIDFVCSFNQLTSLPTLPNFLWGLSCNNNQLTSLPTLPNTLYHLGCWVNQLTSLPTLPSTLNDFGCQFNHLTSLPELPSSLVSFLVDDNPDLLCMPPLLNFTGPSSSYFDITNTGITCLPNVILHSGYLACIDTMPICDLFNLNGCEVAWNIKGNVFLDNDSNCITVNDGVGISMMKMNLFDSGNNLLQQIIANWGGDYSFDTQLGIYSTSVDTSGIPFNIICPDSNIIHHNLTAIDSMDYNVDFRTVCKPGFDIGAWNVIRQPNFFPGNITAVHVIAGDFVQSIYNVTCNSGVSGEVKVIINGPVNSIAPINGALNPIVSGDTLIYAISDFSLINANTDFGFNVFTDTIVQQGDKVCFYVSVTPTAGDNNISNNILSHCFHVSNSYDPNEKEVSPLAIFNQGEWLTYTIHFQNTGTAPAQHIQVLDTLDTDLDASTFQLLSYSHTPMVQLFGSKVHFNFVNINLPDSTTDAEASKGYVSYRVKPLANLPLGATIENTASIYFDFNTPIVTNTVSNIICNPISPTNISETICAGDSYNFNGTTISTAGNYSATFNAINDCDSVVNLNLTVLSVGANALTENICSGDFYNFNGINLSSAGIYFDTLNAINTCDSIITLTLTVETINTTLQQSNGTLSVSSSGTIQWINCNTQQLISGATETIFIPATSGIYAAIITEGNCIDTTSCTQVFTSANQLTVGSMQFAIYPNPTDENITMTLSQPCNNCRIEITNTLGQVIISNEVIFQSSIFNLQSLPAGIYFVELLSDKMNSVKKLVKQ